MMMPTIKYDFTGYDKLSKILEHRKLQDGRYGHPSQKRVRILYGGGKIFAAGSGFLKMLLNKYGDREFLEALMNWEEEQRNRGVK